MELKHNSVTPGVHSAASKHVSDFGLGMIMFDVTAFCFDDIAFGINID